MASEDILQVKLEILHTDVVEVKTALAELSKAITKLALVEQQQSQTAQALERAFKAIAKIENRLTDLEKSQPKVKETSDWVDRFILGVMLVAAGFIGSKLGVTL